MSQSWKCSECGLVNFATAANCKRCSAARETAAVAGNVQPAGIVLQDGYVLPPPPGISGVWRDHKTLIMTKDASLPDQCVKCNAPANGFRLQRKLSWHPPVLYLVILFAWIVYLLLAIVLSKRATVYLGLCTEHKQRRRNLVIAGWVMLAIGLVTPVLGFSSDYPRVGLLGLLLFIVAILWLVLVSRVVTVRKIDDRLVWLTGIDSNYLAQFPSWQHQI